VLVLAIALFGMLGIWLEYRTLFGRQPGVMLLMLFSGLKLLESRSHRDAAVAAFLAYFLIVTNFLYSQSIPTAAAMAVGLVAITATLVGFSAPQRAAASNVRTAGLLLVHAVPAALALFLFFPRVEGPLWGMPRDAMRRPDFPTFYSEVIDANQMQGMFFGFLAAWWPLRKRQNVLFLHYTDMTRDHEGTVRKVADFIGAKPTATQWSSILEYSSFPWMKRHGAKFDAHSVGTVRVLNDGAMIRKGAAGKAQEDGMTDEIARHLRGIGARICQDPVALRWYYEGGKLI
jgi:hypothetical protein